MREKKVNLLKTWKRVFTLFSSSSPFFLFINPFTLTERECVCFFGSLMCLQFDTHIFYDCIYWWWEFLIYRLEFGRWSVWLCGTFHWFRWFFFHYSFVNCALKIHIKGVRISTHAISCNASSYTMFVIRWFLICFRNVTQLKGVKMVYV